MPRRKPAITKPAYRPQIPIDWNKVDEMLEAGSPGTEIAAFLGCHSDTLYDRTVSEKGMAFSQYSAEKKSKGDSKLRVAQFLNALSNNTTMQIWLGKQRLGQKENPGQIIPEEISTAFAEVMRLWADKQLQAKQDQDALNSEDTNIINDK